MRKIFKYMGLCILLLVLLVTVLLVLSQTALFRNVAKEKVLQAVNAGIDGELSIGKIEGNLFTHLRLHDVRLRDRDTLIIGINELMIRYRLLGMLYKRIDLDSIVVKAPFFNIQYRDSAELNIAAVFKSAASPDSSSSSDFPFVVAVKQLVVSGAEGVLQPAFERPVMSLNDIHISASGEYQQGSSWVQIDSLQLMSEQPPFTLEAMRIHFRQEGEAMQLDTLFLKTAHSLLQARGGYRSSTSYDLNVRLNPLSNKDMQILLPSLPVKALPQALVDVWTLDDTTRCDVLLQKDDQELVLQSRMVHLLNGLDNPDQPIDFNALVSFRDWVPEDWLKLATTSAVLNGTINLEGAHLLDIKEDMKLRGKFSGSRYGNVLIDTLRIDATQMSQQIKAELLLLADSSRTEGFLALSDPYFKPRLNAALDFKGLKLAPFVPSLKHTLANGSVEVDGHDIFTEERRLNASLRLFNSSVYAHNIDSVLAKGAMGEGWAYLDTCIVYHRYARADAAGQYNMLHGGFAAVANLQSDSSLLLSSLSLPPISYQKARANMSVNGSLKGFGYTGEVSLSGAGYEDVRIEHLKGMAEGYYGADSVMLDGGVNAYQIENELQSLDSLDISLFMDKSHIKSDLSLSRTDTVQAQISTAIQMADTLTLLLNSAYCQLPYAHFYLTDTLQSIAVYDSTLRIHHLEVKDKMNEAFGFKVLGQLSGTAEQDFSLAVKTFNLAMLNRLMPLVDTLSGELSASLQLKGSVLKPRLLGDYSLQRAAYGSMALPDVEGALGLLDDTAHINAHLPALDSSVYALVRLPLSLRADSVNGLEVQVSDSLRAQLRIDSLKISSPDTAHLTRIQAGAFFNGDIRAEGSFASPQFYGRLEMSDAYVKDHEQGLYYEGMKTDISLKGSTLKVDTIYIGSKKGYFATKGYLVFDSTLVSGRIKASDVISDIRNFDLVQQKNASINISGNPYYRADSLGNPVFGGSITINRSVFNLPGLMDAPLAQGGDENVPLLMAALQEGDSVGVRGEALEEEAKEVPILKQLRGRLTIDIPRSTWLKGDNMNIEISGDFDIAKSADYFELFGDVEILRGYYILYGRKFTIEEGLITFMGGEDLDPRLAISADYVFRGSDRQKHTLSLQVSENLSEPAISFTLDGNAITESDAVSIMVFGKTMDELSYDGQNGIIGSVGSNMLANMVTSSLSSTIGQRLKLDMIEINSTENWSSAAFVVGKYITNDLFVIYQRGFGETEDDEITPETITLEYELNKLLFFRLQSGSSKSSGFDVILKFESTK
ncbi:MULTISPECIES: translocation/assembly module TamB domain-containing protein [unclassified Carboxylicivirga]|uniref:translocation/assembly module TamB domain-containing protein n=1 Tax=Carboxylicivirga TaxID=1628153 RepID=UPI003D33F7F9